jgi:hypothetical protein
MSALRIGDRVQVDQTTEALTIIAIDGGEAWCRDDFGGHVEHRLRHLVLAHSKDWHEIRADEINSQNRDRLKSMQQTAACRVLDAMARVDLS